MEIITIKYCTMAVDLLQLRAAIVRGSEHFPEEGFKMFSMQCNEDAGDASM